MAFKQTPQRLAIRKYLEGNKSHPSAEEIFRDLRETFPTISFATVYSTLRRLRDRGEVRELTIDPARRRYDPDTSAHHHFICRECGRVGDVSGDGMPPVPAMITDDWEVTGYHVELYGRCPRCRKGGEKMAVFVCEKCGAKKEGRCKPKTCPACGGSGTMARQE